MKALCLAFLLFTLRAVSFGQASTDSVSKIQNIKTQKISTDFLRRSLPQPPNSALSAFERVDSILNEFEIESDSIQQRYLHAIAKAEVKTKTVNIAMDSLQKLDLSTQKYISKLHSLQQLENKFESKYKFSFDSLKSKTIRRLQSLDLPPEYTEPLQKLTTNITDLNVTKDIAKIPLLEIPGYSLPKRTGLEGLASKVREVGNIDNTIKLPDVQTSLGDFGKIGAQAGLYQEDLKTVTQGNIQNVEKLPEIIESQASKIDGIDELQKQTRVMDGHKSQLDQLADPKNAKEKAVSVVKEKAIDHFAGKQEQLKSAMDQISKYKQKYSSVSSIKNLPKRPPNPMKGKPIIERLIPGVYFQYQQKTYYLIDVNPYVGYKLSGRLSAGIGWNHRFAYDRKYDRWDKRSRIFGPRAYVDFKLGKGFIAHIEGENMNSFVPSTLLGTPETGQREWVWGCMTGIKKEYRIYKNLKGTAVIQYNLFNRYYKAPYVDRLNSRVGFEYVLKTKKKRGAKS